MSISYMWNEEEHIKIIKTKTLRTRREWMEREKKKYIYIYELITTIMMAQEKWQWISSRLKERRGKKNNEKQKEKNNQRRE